MPAAYNQGGAILRGGVQAEAGMGTDQGRTDVCGTASIIVLLTATASIHHFEHKAQPETFKSLFHSLWWAITTLASVEYGDAYPITTGGGNFIFLNRPLNSAVGGSGCFSLEVV